MTWLGQAKQYSQQMWIEDIAQNQPNERIVTPDKFVSSEVHAWLYHHLRLWKWPHKHLETNQYLWWNMRLINLILSYTEQDIENGEIPLLMKHQLNMGKNSKCSHIHRGGLLHCTCNNKIFDLLQIVSYPTQLVDTK